MLAGEGEDPDGEAAGDEGGEGDGDEGGGGRGVEVEADHSYWPTNGYQR